MPPQRRHDVEVQDSMREAGMAAMLELTRTGRRTGDDAHDAQHRAYELKSTTTGHVGTSRDVGEAYLDRMLARFLVVLRGHNDPIGYQRDAMVVVTPRDVKPWVDALRAKIVADEAIVEKAISGAGDTISQEEATRLRYLGRRGATRNNPKIPWHFILAAGVLLRPGRDAEDLAAVVEAYERGASLAELRLLVGDTRPVLEVSPVLLSASL